MVSGILNGKKYRIIQIETHTPDNFYGTYKGRSIQIDREEDDSFYIIVTDIKSGMADYDGWWRESQVFNRTIEEAIEEALKGAILV